MAGWYPNANSENLATVEVFQNGVWSLVNWSGDYNPPRSPAYATVGTRIYIMGGCIEGDSAPCTRTDVQIFDTETGKFSQGQPMSLAGRHFSGQHAVVRGRYIYVFGGATDLGEQYFNDVAVYDTQADEWQNVTGTMTVPRKSVGSTVFNDQLWIFGGLSQNSVEVGTFQSVEPLIDSP